MKLDSEPSNQEWTVKLSTVKVCVCVCVCVHVRMRICMCMCTCMELITCCKIFLYFILQILLEHLTAVTPYSEMVTLLPRSVATVQKRGAALPLHHLITVEGSWPTARCCLTCEVGPRSVESTGVKPNTVQTGDSCTLKANGSTEHQQHGKEAGSLYTEGQWGMITCALAWVLRLQLCMSLAFKLKSRFDLK